MVQCHMKLLNEIVKILDNVSAKRLSHFGIEFDLINIHINNVLQFNASFITYILLTFMIITLVRCKERTHKAKLLS